MQQDKHELMSLNVLDYIGISNEEKMCTYSAVSGFTILIPFYRSTLSPTH